MKKMLLHIVSDEKFIDSASREFKNCGLFYNFFIIVGRRRKLKYIKNTRVFFINTLLMLLLMPFISIFCSSVVFHSIKNRFDKVLISRIRKGAKVHWISWGFDICHLISDEELISQYPGQTKKEVRRYGNIFYDYTRGSEWLNRIDLISTVLPLEYKLLSIKYKFEKNKYVQWNYSSIEELIPVSFRFNDQSNNVLLGNSGSLYINHLDVFSTLKDNLESFDSIICPLSYGDIMYSDWVDRKGKEVFGMRFVALRDYLEYSEYLEILSSCKSLVLPSKRQIALGNIILFLYFGKPVYLSNSSPTFTFFKELKLPVYSISEFPQHSDQFDIGYVRDELSKIWGSSTKASSLNRIYQLI